LFTIERLQLTLNPIEYSLSKMSSAIQSRRRVVPACKHCENLKLPSTHWLRSLKGDITCPVLLSTECRYCHLVGHTVKSCPELAVKNSKSKTRLPASVAVPVCNKKENLIPNSRFHILYDSDSENECRVHPINDEDENQNTKPSWSEIMQRPKLSLQLPETCGTHFSVTDVCDTRPISSPSSPPPIEYKPFETSYYAKFAGKPWSEMSDSDSDYE
jgi:hypothetical protein